MGIDVEKLINVKQTTGSVIIKKVRFLRPLMCSWLVQISSYLLPDQML